MNNKERTLQFEHGFNFRELGGYQTKNGQALKWHQLIRSAHLADFTMQDQQRLYRYGIRTIIDLRSSSEVATYPDRLGSRLKYLRLPVFDNDITESNVDLQDARNIFAKDPQAGYKRMLSVYQEFVENEQAQAAFHQFIKVLGFQTSHGGVLFHCSAGKDRTGLATVYLLNLLGVSKQQILRDYLLTNQASKKRIHDRLEYAAKLNLGDAYLRSIYDLSTANKHYYSQALSVIDKKYGGMQTYLHDVLQISNSMVEQLKYIYLEK